MSEPRHKGGPLSSSEREQICFLKGQGKSNRQIADKLGRSHGCIDNFVSSHLARPGAIVDPKAPDIARVEFKWVLTEYILTATLTDRFISCRALSLRIADEFKVSCSKSQVAIIRRALGLRHLWAKKTEKLKPGHIDKRWRFAIAIQRRPEFNMPWIISDESSFVMCPTRKKLYRFRGEHSEAIFQEFQGYPVKCMVWGAIGPGYKSPLIWFKEYITAQTYVQQLEQNDIFKNLDLQFGCEGYIFQQDGARPHTAVHSLTYFRQRKVRMLPPDASWPACSPDLSPIEQIWGAMKHQINITAATAGPESFFNEILRIWNAIPISTVNNYMNSLKPRIWALEDLQGRSLTGRNDLIHEYEKDGFRARPRVHMMLPRGCISIADSKEWFAKVEELMKEVSALGMNLEIHQRLEQLHRDSERMHSLLPQKK
jgi:transposase